MTPIESSRRLFLVGTLAAAACSKSLAGNGPRGRAILPPPLPSTSAMMPMRRLGKTGVNVSLVGLGGAHIGKQKEEAESIRIIRSAVDRGINFLDNCWDYNEGKSEERMGKALLDGYRQKVFLMTKVDGRTKEAAAQQLEQSLQRLACASRAG